MVAFIELLSTVVNALLAVTTSYAQVGYTAGSVVASVQTSGSNLAGNGFIETMTAVSKQSTPHAVVNHNLLQPHPPTDAQLMAASLGASDNKKATTCPANYPVCWGDSDCVTTACAAGGCDWLKAPSTDTDPGTSYNYIEGSDALGTVCLRDYQAPTSAPTDASTQAPTDAPTDAPTQAPTQAAGGTTTTTTVQATTCPAKYPVCFQGCSTMACTMIVPGSPKLLNDCVTTACADGCEWEQAPSTDTEPGTSFNYVDGSDALGTACSGDYQAAKGKGRRLQAADKAADKKTKAKADKKTKEKEPQYVNCIWSSISSFVGAIFTVLSIIFMVEFDIGAKLVLPLLYGCPCNGPINDEHGASGARKKYIEMGVPECAVPFFVKTEDFKRRSCRAHVFWNIFAKFVSSMLSIVTGKSGGAAVTAGSVATYGFVIGVIKKIQEYIDGVDKAKETLDEHFSFALVLYTAGDDKAGNKGDKLLAQAAESVEAAEKAMSIVPEKLPAFPVMRPLAAFGVACATFAAQPQRLSLYLFGLLDKHVVKITFDKLAAQIPEEVESTIAAIKDMVNESFTQDETFAKEDMVNGEDPAWLNSITDTFESPEFQAITQALVMMSDTLEAAQTTVSKIESRFTSVLQPYADEEHEGVQEIIDELDVFFGAEQEAMEKLMGQLEPASMIQAQVAAQTGKAKLEEVKKQLQAVLDVFDPKFWIVTFKNSLESALGGAILNSMGHAAAAVGQTKKEVKTRGPVFAKADSRQAYIELPKYADPVPMLTSAPVQVARSFAIAPSPQGLYLQQARF